MNSTDEKAAELPSSAQDAANNSSSSAYCAAKALALLQAAVRMPSGVERTTFERSAAAWSMRAEQLSRSEAKAAQALPGACAEFPDPAESEVGNNRGSV